ncbi:hypothetical protein JHK87_050690 [Glycine soja]|nr:hypothetical protein JHK87_050690 [Glycine soja]
MTSSLWRVSFVPFSLLQLWRNLGKVVAPPPVPFPAPPLVPLPPPTPIPPVARATFLSPVLPRAPNPLPPPPPPLEALAASAVPRRGATLRGFWSAARTTAFCGSWLRQRGGCRQRSWRR